MPQLADLVAHLDELLSIDRFKDYGPNGLQVPGPAGAEVERVVSGVTASRALIEAAIERRAQLVIAHHGLFWRFHAPGLSPVVAERFHAPGLSPVVAERVRLLFKHDVALAGYHLPLDAHPVLGNNAILAERLGSASHDPWAEHEGVPIGRRAVFPDGGVALDDLVSRVREVTGREPLVFAGGPRQVRTLGIVSGGAADDLALAAADGLDAFLTGEPREHVMAEAMEAGVTFVAAGHYATETFGIRAIGEHLAGTFGVEHAFVDLPNPV